MMLSKVVEHLRQHCHSFEQRIAVALDFDPDRGQLQMDAPAAAVMPDGDDAQPPISQNVAVQEITDRFAVVLIVRTASKQRGDKSADDIHLLRAEIWRALIGWSPGDSYSPVEYVGGEVISMNRNITYYNLSFESVFTVGYFDGLPEGEMPETWQEYELANLPELEAVDLGVDVIDPIADPNLKKPGPDGRIEFKLREEV